MVKRPLGLICLLMSGLLFLLTRSAPMPSEEYDQKYEQLQGQTLTLIGRVYKKETARQAKGVVMVLYLKTDPEGARVMCYLSPDQSQPEVGSHVRIRGKAACFERASNPGQFDARSYYRIFGISYRLNQAVILAKTTKYDILPEKLFLLRAYLADCLSGALPEKEASVMQTMLLGEKSGMEKELKKLYQRNGIAHILAISGLHISMLGMGFYRLIRKCGVPMKAAAVLSAGALVLYGMMTGFSVSALRAIFMFGLQMLAVLTERTYDTLTAAALAAVSILLYQPLYFGHSGFVFSFGCVFGIALVLPALTENNTKAEKRNCPPVKNVLILRALKAVSGGIGIAVITLPIYLWYYYQFPVYSILLNLLVIPLMSVLMAAGLLLVACRMICPWFPGLAFPFSLGIRFILGIYEKMCSLCGNLPGNLLTPGKPEVWRMVLYLLLLLFLVQMKKKLRLSARWGIAALAVGILLWIPGPGILLPGMQITFLDVGQGDCIYVESRQGERYLIDGGSSSVSSVGEYRIMPFLKYQGAGQLDAVFVTHPDEDHCNGIRELLEQGEAEGIRVKNLVLPDIADGARNEGYQELEQAAETRGIPVSYIGRGQQIINRDMTFVCLHPRSGASCKEANEYSMVLKLTCGNFSVMLTGDVEGAGEKQMIDYLQKEKSAGRLTILKAAHHGSGNSTPNELLEDQRPLYTVISCGKNNSYGHPHAELLERLAHCGSNVMVTYETGAVTFRTDGKKVRVAKSFLLK